MEAIKFNRLELHYNEIDNRWKVLNDDGFCRGDGKTPKEAIESAWIVTKDDVYFDGKAVKYILEFSDEDYDNDFDLKVLNSLAKSDKDYCEVDEYTIIIFKDNDD